MCLTVVSFLCALMYRGSPLSENPIKPVGNAPIVLGEEKIQCKCIHCHFFSIEFKTYSDTIGLCSKCMQSIYVHTCTCMPYKMHRITPTLLQFINGDAKVLVSGTKCWQILELVNEMSSVYIYWWRPTVCI